MNPQNPDHSPENASESEVENLISYRYGLRTVMDLFDIGPSVAIGVLATAFLVLLAGIVYFVRSAPPSAITISSGPKDSFFHRTAIRYAKKLEKSGVKVEVLTSSGSLQNLERLSDSKSKVDLAIVQGGIKDRETRNRELESTAPSGTAAEAISADPTGSEKKLAEKKVKLDQLVSLGSITNQPMMVFYRGSEVQLLSELKGKKIAVGVEGSGTRQLALRMLSVNGIKEKDLGTTQLLNLDSDEAAKALENDQIDAAFVMSENASYSDIRKMQRSKEVRLLSFKQADAYVRKIDYLNVFQMPEGSIDLGLNLPDRDVFLVGPMVELVATANLHPAISDLILDAATEIHSRPSMFQKRGEFPMAVEHLIPMSEDAVRFYKTGKTFLYRYLPYWLASLISRFIVVLLPILILLVPALRAVPSIFRWRTKMKIRNRYRELLILEEKFRKETDPKRLAALRRSFERIDQQTSQMRMRAAFADQFYLLRGHIDYVRILMSKKYVI